MSSVLPEPGQIVIVRQRPFVVSAVATSTLPLPATLNNPEQRQHLVQLSSVEDEGLGEEVAVVWELEPGATCLERARLPALKGFDPPRVLDAFLDAVAWGSVSSADDKALQAPFRSGVEVDDYQLDPVVRALVYARGDRGERTHEHRLSAAIAKSNREKFMRRLTSGRLLTV